DELIRVFFFQAEDGIRDATVTGVQTCALPIWTEQDRAVRGNHNYGVIARLKADVEVQQAQAEMATISKRLEQQYPGDDKGWGARSEERRGGEEVEKGEAKSEWRKKLQEDEHGE